MPEQLQTDTQPSLTSLVAGIITEMVQIGYAFRHLDCARLMEMQQNLQVLCSLEWLE